MVEEEDLIQTAMTDITQLCAENVILWAQFLEVVLCQPRVHLHLARQHHNTRVRQLRIFFSVRSKLDQIWPSGELTFECEKIAKNLTLKKKLPKIVIFSIFFEKNENF